MNCGPRSAALRRGEGALRDFEVTAEAARRTFFASARAVERGAVFFLGAGVAADSWGAWSGTGAELTCVDELAKLGAMVNLL